LAGEPARALRSASGKVTGDAISWTGIPLIRR
jgi:hypothetical protein